MSVGYAAVSWNRFKKRHDLVLFGLVVAWIVVFLGVSLALEPAATPEILMMRATGAGGLVLLHVILGIGPLARVDRRFLPLLYNRRHLGVTMFLLGLVHAVLAIATYHVGSDANPIVSVFTTDAGATLGSFPFQAFGFVALLILFALAATSHDFWLRNLTAPMWKALHMGVYVAYAALLIHVAFGVLQAELHPGYVLLFVAGFTTLAILHLRAAAQERRVDASRSESLPDRFVEVCPIDAIAEDRARIACIGGERVAVFRYDGKVSAVSNVCQHQNGPLGEGKVIDGCITCPWHGYQYQPATGAAPAPFTEKLPTFEVRVVGGKVFVDPTPKSPGTYVEPARIEAGLPAPADDGPFFVGAAPERPAGELAFVKRGVLVLALSVGGLGAGLAAMQSTIRSAWFDYGNVSEYRGVLVGDPVPMLLLAKPEATTGARVVLLVNEWKYGFDPTTARELNLREVSLRGTLIHDGQGQAMLEVAPDSVVATADRAVARDAALVVEEELGEATLRGEIVDSKCYLGVMNPGVLKPHRACAIHCIRGGVPPILLVRTDDGPEHYVLVGPEGEALNDAVLDLVALPVEVQGRVVSRGGLKFLHAATGSIRSL